MEDIIIWIVFIAIGALWEFISKKKSDSRSGARSAAPAQAIPEAAARLSVQTPPRPVSPHITERPKPEYRPMSVVDAEPISEVEILSDTPLADTPLTLDTDAPAGVAARPDAVQLDREAHFRRWRQAIIDTQVLERKF